MVHTTCDDDGVVAPPLLLLPFLKALLFGADLVTLVLNESVDWRTVRLERFGGAMVVPEV